MTSGSFGQKRLSPGDPDTADNAKRGHEDDPAKRAAWFLRGRTVKGENAGALLRRAYRQKLRMRQALQRQMAQRSGGTLATAPGITPMGAQFTATGGPWTNLGPAPITGMGNIGDASGRITAVAVDQCDTTGNTVLMGGAYGGVWRSTNAANATPGNVTWTALYDYQAAATTLAVGALSLQPNNCSGSTSQVILVGTGEPDFALDSYYGHGILRSTDGGTTWALISCADGCASPFDGMGVARFAWSSTSPNLVVASFSNGAVTFGLGTGTNQGMYYSTDAGATWHKANNATDGGFGSASDVVWNSGQSKFYAAFRGQGLYQSSDGIQWTRLAAQPFTFTANCNTTNSCDILRAAITVLPGSSDMYVWGVKKSDFTSNLGIAKSANGGASWSTLSFNGISSCGDSAGCFLPNTSQGFYDLYLQALPNGTSTDLYAGAVNLFKCTIPAGQAGTLCGAALNGSTSGTNRWMNLTHVYGTCGGNTAYLSIHPDNHGIDFVQVGANANKIVYFGNDGGAYRTLNNAGVNSGICTTGSGNPFDDLNTSTLGSLTQFIYISQHPTDASVIQGGTQDNGTPGTASGQTNPPLTPPLWFEGWGGDGGFNQIDQTNPQNWFTENTDVSIVKCISGTDCLENVPFNNGASIGSAQVGNDHGAFYTPFILDPANQSTILVGTCHVWSGPTTGANLTLISPNFETGLAGGVCSGNESNLVSFLAAGGTPVGGVSPVIYVGTAAGRVWVTTNANLGASATWTDVAGSGGSSINPSGFPISYFAIDPTDATGQTAYVTIMGFSGDPQGRWHLFKTTNAGGNWTDVGIGLPDAPADAVAIDPRNHNVLYVGTDVGVFLSRDGGGTWQEYGTDLPNVAIVALQIFNSGGVQKIRVGTHGRGAWENDLAVLNQTPVAVSVTPNSGIGSPQTFAALYSDGDGFADIAQAYIEINTTNSLVGACAAYYDSASNSLFLNQNNGSGWLGPVVLGTAGTLSNSQCSLDTGATTVSGSVNNLTVNFALTFPTSFGGVKNVFLDVVDASAATSGWQQLGTWTIPVAPAAISVTPNSGTFTTQTFAMQYFDGNGFGDIGQAYVEFNSSNSLVGACAAYYDAVNNGLFINTDDGAGWTGPVTVGQAGVLSNSQCSFNTGTASVNGSGNNLTLNLAITFSGSFTGAKNTYLNVIDKEALTSGWQLLGTWTPAAAVAPTPVSVTPNTGGGASQTFSFLYSSVNGYLSIGSVETLINTSQTNANGCVVFYNRVNNTLQLQNDAGTTFSAPVTMGQVGTLSNTQCTVNAGTSSAVGSGANLTVNLALSFASSFSGTKQVFMWAKNTGSLASGFVNKGTWTVPGSAIQAVSVTPNTGSGASQTFSFLYSHPSGFASITATEILINQYLVNSNGCVVFFDRIHNTLQLQNDAGNGWLGPLTMGQAGTLSNTQCTLNTGASSVAGAGTNLTVNLALTFTSAFPGKRNIYMWAKDAAVNTGWQQRGNWTPFPSVAPTPVSVTPSSGAGASQTFSLLYSDTSGWTAIGAAEVLINGSLKNANGCVAFYNRSAQTVQLQNDAGNAWLGPLPIGQAGTLQNTQCSINVGASSFVGSANNLTVNLAITFKAGFSGSKLVYMWVKDNGSLNSGWQQRGTWTAP